MRPPVKQYERVPVGIEIAGEIQEVQYDENRTFKAFKEGEEDKTCLAVRFKFKLDGCAYAHYSRWMKFSVGSQSTLYSKYLVALVENARPDMDMDLDELNGMRVITTWSENGDFQNLETIAANGPMITADIAESSSDKRDNFGQELPF